MTTAALVFVAAEDAAAWAGPIKIVGKAKIGDKDVVREARYAGVVWGTPNRQQQPPEFRLAPVVAARRDRQGNGARLRADRRGQGL